MITRSLLRDGRRPGFVGSRRLFRAAGDAGSIVERLVCGGCEPATSRWNLHTHFARIRTRGTAHRWTGDLRRLVPHLFLKWNWDQDCGGKL